MGLLAGYSGPAKPGTKKDDDDGFSVFGFLGNLAGDVGELVTGLGRLGGEVIHDVGRGIAQVIPGEQSFGIFDDTDKSGYHLDDIAKALPGAIAGDYKKRYATDVGSSLYNDPLSYILDAIGLGSLASSGARIAGGAAIKGTSAAGTAATISKNVLESLASPAGKVSRNVGRVAKAAGIKAGLDELAGSGQLTPGLNLARKILPSQSAELIGGKFVPTIEALNPVTRAALKPIQRKLTQPIGVLEQTVASKAAEIAEYRSLHGPKVPEEMIADYGYHRSVLEEAHSLGLSRITKPKVSDAMANLAARRFWGATNGRFLNQRLEATRRYQAELNPYLKEAPELADEGAAWMTGLRFDVPGYESAPWFAKQYIDVDAPLEPAALNAPVLAGGGGGVALGAPPTPLRTGPSPAAQAALDGANPIAQRVESVAEGLRAYKARLADPTDLVHDRIGDAAGELDAVDRMIDHLYAGLDRRILHDGPDPSVIDAGARMVDSARLLDLEKMVDEFGALKSTPRQVLEETYVPLRLKYGAKWSADGTQLEGGPSLAELDDAIRAADEVAPTYMPFIDPETMKGSDFFTSKQTVGANVYARDPHLKRMKGVRLMEGSYVRNPAEALTRRAARGVRSMATFRQIMDATKQFGRPIAKADDVPPGFVIVAPDLMFVQKRTGFHLEDSIDDLLSQGMDRDAATAQALEAVTVRNQDDVAKLLAEGSVKMWAVPKVVADRMTDAARAAGFISGKTRLWHDTIMSAWRGIVLSGSPRWVVNNFFGNSVFAALQGVKTADVIKSLGAHFKERVLGGESTMLRELRKLPGFEDVAGGFTGSAVEQYEYLKPALAESPTYRVLQKIGSKAPVSWAKHFGEGMKSFNGLIEDSYRTASFLTAAEKQLGIGSLKRTARSFMGSQKRVAHIMESGFTEANGKAALMEMNGFFGNYGALGPYERHVFRRWLFPFYGFYKHQAKLLLSFPIDQPGKAQLASQLGAIQEEMRAEYGEVPEWLEGAVPFGPPGAEVPFFSSRGPNPFGMSLEAWTDMLSPIIKIGFERATGRSLFTGDPYSDEDTITPFGSDQAYRIIRDEQGNVVGVEKRDPVLPSLPEHILQQLPHYDALKESIAGGATYDTASLLDILAGGGTLTDETGAPKYPSGVIEQLLKLTGIGTTPYDLASYQDRAATEAKTALTAAKNRGGKSSGGGGLLGGLNY